jgi:hypothetical protein
MCATTLSGQLCLPRLKRIPTPCIAAPYNAFFPSNHSPWYFQTPRSHHEFRSIPVHALVSSYPPHFHIPTASSYSAYSPSASTSSCSTNPSSSSSNVVLVIPPVLFVLFPNAALPAAASFATASHASIQSAYTSTGALKVLIGVWKVWPQTLHWRLPTPVFFSIETDTDFS